uniref:Ubiquitously expressed prefoldin like chaperone n=1 Tax=Equus asinus asinus TaxID=83772 RepID=A0A8C4L6H1_EQUAS
MRVSEDHDMRYSERDRASYWSLFYSCPIRKVLEHRDKVYEQLAKYLQLRNVIERLQVKTPGLGTIVGGWGTKKRCQGEIPQTKTCCLTQKLTTEPSLFFLAPQEAKHSELYMQVDLGCNFFVDTVVPDTSRIYVALGYGFFLELTLAEALRFIDRKSNLLTELSNSLTKDSMNIKAHIHMLLEVRAAHHSQTLSPNV